MEPLRLAVIVGGVRQGRFGPAVANWFVGQARSRGDAAAGVLPDRLLWWADALREARNGNPYNDRKQAA
ncbi:hypothetical protein ACFQ08_09405 [Streptosporangium algeriense]|uniref:Uncharacterized protein n=1 Tax=Streptosporangium algeriense TaxID=1682748 RepID=A0ABW3DP07_9ACTN